MGLFRFEHHTEKLATHAAFVSRIAVNILAAIAIIALALTSGMMGYRLTEHMSWLDAFLNSAMLLGGMGPVSTLATDGGKLFAGIYALTCGLVFVLVTGVVLAPVFHRVLHALKVEDSED